MSWTDDRVDVLKKLWGEGKTAAEIAKELGGVTRNAVIGKAHRLKLSNRVSPIQQNKKPAPVKAPVEKKAKQIIIEDNDREKLTLIELSAGMCRWPIGDPRDKANFGFCGGESMPSLPYCTEHAKVAYQAATRNRILKSESQAAKATKMAQKAAKTKKAANQ